MEIYCVKEVEQNPVPKSQTKPFYIGTKEAPSESMDSVLHYITAYLMKQITFSFIPRLLLFLKTLKYLNLKTVFYLKQSINFKSL